MTNCGGLGMLRSTMSIVALAKDLGLSISTVSRALNDYEDVSVETRKRIQQRALETGYRPNPGARRMKARSTSAIGVVLPSAGDGVHFVESVFSSFLGGAALELEKEGFYLVATIQSGTDRDRETALYENFIKGSWVDALLIVRTRCDDSRISLANRAGFPFVTYGRTDSKDPYAWIDTDNEKAFFLATARQIAFGHRRVALLNGPAEYYFARLRKAGYLRALAEHNLTPDPLLILSGDLTEVSGYSLCRSLLVSAKPPTAILCATDTMAIGAYAACRERGLKIGKDVSIMSYGNSSGSEFCDPPLTTIDHRVYDNGRHAGQAILKLLRGQAEARDIHYLEPVILVPRQSDGPVA